MKRRVSFFILLTLTRITAMTNNVIAWFAGSVFSASDQVGRAWIRVLALRLGDFMVTVMSQHICFSRTK